MTVELRDGSRVVIRSIEPATVRRSFEGFERLSPESRYRRFFGPVTHLSERDLDYLTCVDHHDHEALVAVAEGTGEGVGVARYVRTGPDVAEPAIVVADDWQGRGAGPAARSARRACPEEGYGASRRRCSRTTRKRSQLLERLGQTTRTYDGREVELTIELPEAERRSARGGRCWGPVRGRGRCSLPGRCFDAPLALPCQGGARGAPPAQPHRRRDRRVRSRDRRAGGGRRARSSDRGAAIEVVAVAPLPADRPGRSSPRRSTQPPRTPCASGGCTSTRRLGRGDPALVLAGVAAEENARLIVVGGGERGKPARRIIGSVADLVVERATCDVLIVARASPVEPTPSTPPACFRHGDDERARRLVPARGGRGQPHAHRLGGDLRGPRAYEDTVLAAVAAKLDLVPRYRQRVRFPPLALARPIWVDDATSTSTTTCGTPRCPRRAATRSCATSSAA